MKNTIIDFENNLLDLGLTMDDLEENKQFIRDWFYETEDITFDEMVEDFMEWLISHNKLGNIKLIQ